MPVAGIIEVCRWLADRRYGVLVYSLSRAIDGPFCSPRQRYAFVCLIQRPIPAIPAAS